MTWVRKHFSLICVSFLFLLALAFVFSISSGYIRIPLTKLVFILKEGPGGKTPISPAYSVVWDIRLPRALLAIMVGAALALAGCLLQAVLENPLADPYILGVSAGAGVGAAVGMLVNLVIWVFWLIPFGAFIGAFFTVLLVYFLSQRQGILSSLRLVLYGVGVGSMLSALLSLLLLKNPTQITNVYYWMLGSVSGQGWQAIVVTALVFFPVWGFVCFQAVKLNALLLGEENSYHLGINIFQLKRVLLLCGTLITAVAVAYSGLIGFVGLIIPHISRMMTGGDHRRLLVLAPILGALLMLTCDTLARILFLPGEIPVGIITALLGGPLFIFLLSSSGAKS